MSTLKKGNIWERTPRIEPIIVRCHTVVNKKKKKKKEKEEKRNPANPPAKTSMSNDVFPYEGPRMETKIKAAKIDRSR